MTLVSLTGNYGNPILISDILTTSNTPGKNVEMPVFLESVDGLIPADNQFFPYDLRQKSYVINNNIALVMAGNVYQMTKYLEDIKNYFKYFEPTDDNYKKFAEQIDSNSINECSILVSIISPNVGNEKLQIYTLGQWSQLSHPLIETGLVAGSGTNSFVNLIESQNISQNESSPLAMNLMLLGQMIVDERFTLNSILEAWGGGFELIEFADSKFQKIDDLTYVILRGKYSAEKGLEQYPELVLRYKYYNEILAIYSYDRDNIKGYGVLPLDIKKADVNHDEIPTNIDFVSSLTVGTVVIEDENGNIHFRSLISHPSHEIPHITVEVLPNGTYTVSITEQKINELIQSIERHMR